MTERGVLFGGMAAFVALCAVAIWLHVPAQVASSAAPLATPTADTAPVTPAAPSPVSNIISSPVGSPTSSAFSTPAIALPKPAASVAASTPTAVPVAVQSTPLTSATALAQRTPTAVTTPASAPTQAASSSASGSSGSTAKKVEQDIAKQLATKVIEFESVSEKLTDKGKAVLSSLVPLLAQDPTSRFEIGGHTDSWGEKEFNQALSERRARTVRAYLVSKGVDGGRLTARGYGDSKPIANNKTTAGSRKNRRIEFTAQ